MFTRRQLFRLATLFGASRLFPASRAAAAQSSSPPLPVGSDIYKAIGVRPLINCRGTITVIGGSIDLPEVRAAKTAANQQHVQLDELMEAVGKRLAGLTGAEGGMGSARCAAAMSHATAALGAGGNPGLRR